MSTESTSRRSRSRARRTRAFLTSFALVIGVLAVIGAVAATVGVVQGPRVTSVQVDPDAAAAASGSRLIMTTSQSLAEIDPSQVTIEPAAAFAVDTSGRNVGIRFTPALWDDTEYTVTVRGVQGIGGGPTTTLTETFRTPAIDVHLLQRDTADGDVIFRTDLTGEQAVPVFTHPHIEDYRATVTHLVVSVRTETDLPALIVTDLDGENERELPLPAEDGTVSALQTADRGETIGYVFTEASLGEEGGIESTLFTTSASGDDEATAIEVTGADSRVAEWRFVPETDSILLLGFDSTLMLTGAEGGTGTSLGSAIGIEGVAGTDAIVERIDGMTVVDLTDGSEAPLDPAAANAGILASVLPMPGGDTLRATVLFDDAGLPVGTTVTAVDPEGQSREVADVAAADALLQTCVSPSARYAALLVAPDAVSNPYDQYLLPLPERLETRIVDVTTGESVVDLTGFDISWCRVPPT